MFATYPTLYQMTKITNPGLQRPEFCQGYKTSLLRLPFQNVRLPDRLMMIFQPIVLMC